MSGEINILIDEIEAIANNTRGHIAGIAKEGGSAFQSATLGAGVFNGIPAGLEFFSQQQAAHQVFVETINGVVADLEQFGDTLASNAANHRAVDESNADSMNAHEIAQAQQADQQAAAQAMENVNQDYSGAEDGEGLESEEAYDESREGNEALNVQTEHDGGAEAPEGPGAQPDAGAPDDAAVADDYDQATQSGGMR